MEGFICKYYSSSAGSHIYQRFVLDIPGVFPYPFSLLLEKNDLVDDCVENSVLQDGLKSRDRRQLAKTALSEAFHRNQIVLSSFNGWFPQAVTRSSLLSADGIGPFKSIPTISIDDIVVVKSLTARRSIKLVEHNGSHYIMKMIDQFDEIHEWENELKTLLLLRDSPNIINIAALVDIANPYSPHDSRVVSGFLIEYASSGSLYEKLDDNGGKGIEFGVKIKWALDITEGLRDMHAKGLVHGDIKPRNVVITGTNVAKLIDFAGKGYSKGYHAPEMFTIIDSDVLWPKTLDMYAFGILLRELFPSIPIEPPIEISEFPKLNNLISACLSENPDDRPHISDAITSIKQMRGLN